MKGPDPPSILLFGNNAHLLETRRWVLECAGYEAHVATHFLALKQILADGPINVLILCHSLTEEECDRARSIVTMRFPKSKVLVLAVNDCPASTKDEEQVVSTGDGPKSMLETVDHLVNNPVPPEPSSDAVKTRPARGLRHKPSSAGAASGGSRALVFPKWETFEESSK